MFGPDSEVTYYEYDSNGNLTKLMYDEYKDGTIDEKELYTYNSNGQLIKLKVIGFANSTSTFVYSSIGNNVYYQIDAESDGSIENTVVYKHNANGDVIMGKIYCHDSRDNEHGQNSLADLKKKKRQRARR